MSGHSKWHSIKHKKGANDAARGKIFTRHGKLITIATREGGGGDPEMNPSLRLAIEKAKAENMPNANIERAIKKGTGEDKDGAQLMELTYEGYGPSGSAILVETLTDNKNRTVSSVRSTFTKKGGNMGESGSVAFLFDRKGVIRILCDSEEKGEEIALEAIDAGAEDFKYEDGEVDIFTAPTEVMAVKKLLEEMGEKIESAEITMIAKNTIEISDPEKAKTVLTLIETLEDNEDVSAVHSNVYIPTDVLDQIL